MASNQSEGFEPDCGYIDPNIMDPNQSDGFEPDCEYTDLNISDRYESELSNRYSIREPDGILNLDVRDRLGSTLWDTFCARQPRVSGRIGCHVFSRRNTRPDVMNDRENIYRMSYSRSRRVPFSSLRTCSRGSISDRYCSYLNTVSSRERRLWRETLDTMEEDTNSNYEQHSEGDARGRPDLRMTSELETTASDKQESSFMCFWRIENFCINEASQSFSINSQMFDVLMIDSSQWQLRVEHSQFDSLRLFLYRHSEKECCDIHVELSVLTTGGWYIVKDGIYAQFSSTTPYIDAKLLNWFELLQVKTRLPDDCLTVSCHISIQSSLFNPLQYFMPSRIISHKLVVHSPILEFSDLMPNEVLNFPIPSILLEYLSVSDYTESKSTQTEDQNFLINDLDENDLQKQFKEKTSCYVTLRTPTKDFAVHKAILCAKSPVFSSMVRETMAENNSNVVNVDDIDGDCLSLMKYFYLEPLGELGWEEAAKLYYAANNYQTDQLKAECRSFLKKTLSDRNICDAFILSDTHKDEDLRESSQEYFCKNSKTILCSPEWNQFLYNRVDLASKVLYKYGERM